MHETRGYTITLPYLVALALASFPLAQYSSSSDLVQLPFSSYTVALSPRDIKTLWIVFFCLTLSYVRPACRNFSFEKYRGVFLVPSEGRIYAGLIKLRFHLREWKIDFKRRWRDERGSVGRVVIHCTVPRTRCRRVLLSWHIFHATLRYKSTGDHLNQYWRSLMSRELDGLVDSSWC